MSTYSSSSAMSSSSSDSGYDTVTEAHSPPATIRRPLDLPAVPVMPRDSLSPNPVAIPESPHQIATPVIITPVDRRSTRELVHGRVARRRNPMAGNILNSIRRRLSLATSSELRMERSLRSLTSRITRITSEKEASEEFGQALLASLEKKTSPEEEPTTSPFPSIPSESTTRARIREQNRLEAVEMAEETLEMGADACQSDIQDSLALLETNMRLMGAESEMIDQVLEDYEQETRELHAKWTRIEEIMALVKDL